ncbi:hypothetical protein LV89_01820 [Arcicella aurantiaca]|uniref:Uncharacterized protein n=1 Tax=Arcicella aurantiaca TaxID=591202 RepID=A0A316EBQ0_9BACT|nr:hypothetical protein [Arcicella aurantiaca]PWK27008.1 hypothetical protein LV89_01820 [Arcicella aurantiaca]
MFQETYKGCRPTLKGEYPTRKFKLSAQKQVTGILSLTLLASHCTPASSVLSEKKTYTEEGVVGNKSREFIVSASSINDVDVKFCKISQELALRPTVINTINVAHDAGFDAIQLVIKNESVFNETQEEVVLPTVLIVDDEAQFFVFDLTALNNRIITNGTTSIVLQGIGEVAEINAEFILGQSYAIF